MSIPNPSNPMFWIVVALIVAYFGVDYIGLIPAAFGKLWSFVPGLPKIPVTSPVDEDALDLESYKRLMARYVRLNCPEGIAAMEQAGHHFLHGVGGA